MNTKKRGKQAEQKASYYLKRHGLTLHQCNYRCKLGEIDLIMQDNTQLVFVEVRSRSNNQFNQAIDSIDYYKQQKIIRTAHYYLLEQHQYEKISCRFDVVIVTNNQIQWIPNAFDSSAIPY